MTGRSPADYGMTSHAASQALHEVRELRRRQHDHLRSWRHFVGGTLVLYLSTSVIVVAASGEAAAAGAARMLTGGLILLGIAFLIEVLTIRWSDGPDTVGLLYELPRRRTPRSVDLHLIDLHRADHATNNNILLCVKWAAIIQAGAAAIMIILVIGALLGITADQLEDIDAPAPIEQQNPELSRAAPQP